MSTNDTAVLTPKERHDKLIELWCAVLERLHSLFTNPPSAGIRASYYAVAIQFLRNNGITAQDMKDPQEGMEALVASIAEVTRDDPENNIVALNQPF